eukprot:3419765-Rhodomonas_salina.2
MYVSTIFVRIQTRTVAAAPRLVSPRQRTANAKHGMTVATCTFGLGVVLVWRPGREIKRVCTRHRVAIARRDGADSTISEPG